jgi:AcrR family transcriptional regulator
MSNPFQKPSMDERRAHILRAAIAVMSAQGYPRTTIKQIAREAGIADGTIYNYFRNKEAILIAIIQQITEAEMRDLQFQAGQEMTLRTFVAMYVRHRMDEIAADLPAIKIMLAETMVNPDLAATVYHDVYEPAFTVAEEFFAGLVAQGMLPAQDPAFLVRAFAAPVFGIMMLRALGDEHVAANWTGYVDIIVDLLLNGLAPAGA